MTSSKSEYEALKTKQETLKDNISTLQGKKEVAEQELVKIDAELKKLTKGKDPQEVLAKLDKEIEVRLELIRGDVTKMEREVELFMSDEEVITDESFSDNSSSSDFDFDLEDSDEDKN